MSALSVLAAVSFTLLEPGLELAEIAAPAPPSHGDGVLAVVRIDPARFELRLLMASEQGGKARTAEAWAVEFDLVLAVNAGMFDADGRTGTHLMRGPGHVNNPHLHRDNAVLAFAPRKTARPAVRIIDRTCEDFPALRRRYRGLVQGIRMLSCTGENTWSVQAKKWSAVVLGLDGKGRVLVFFARSPYRMHDLVERVRGLSLGVVRLMYLEGGPEASLFLDAGGVTRRLFGSYETGFNENDDNDRFWPVPNVLGFVRRPPPAMDKARPGP